LYDHETPLLDDLADLLYFLALPFTVLAKTPLTVFGSLQTRTQCNDLVGFRTNMGFCCWWCVSVWVGSTLIFLSRGMSRSSRKSFVCPPNLVRVGCILFPRYPSLGESPLLCLFRRAYLGSFLPRPGGDAHISLFL